MSSCDDAPSLFLAEPIAAHDLARAVNDIVAEHRLAREARNVHTLNDDPNGIVAQSSVMQKVMALVERAALGDSPVLLLGESGTGKELLARALHRKGPRPRGPFVAVNCSAIPDTLLESELFGHRQGAFTDARKDRRGLFQAANHGTIFLDEIGDMAPTLQGKLMRALQEKEVHPLGADAPVPIDVLSVPSAPGSRRPSFASLSYNGVFGSAVSSPTIATWIPESTMKRYCCSNVFSVSLSKPMMKPAKMSRPCL